MKTKMYARAILSGLFAATLVVAQNAYVVSQTTNSVSVINTSSNAIVATIPVGTTPQFVATTPDRAKVYVTNAGSATVR